MCLPFLGFQKTLVIVSPETTKSLHQLETCSSKLVDCLMYCHEDSFNSAVFWWDNSFSCLGPTKTPGAAFKILFTYVLQIFCVWFFTTRILVPVSILGLFLKPLANLLVGFE